MKHLWLLPWGLAAVLALLQGGCSHPQSFVVAELDPNNPPQTLSAWNVIRIDDDGLHLATGGHHYALNTPLFSDYAQKIRTLHVPHGQQLSYDNSGAFEAPTGTVISKTFLYPKANGPTGKLQTVSLSGSEVTDLNTISHDTHQIIETRLLVKTALDWVALPYRWQGDDAYLAITGDLLEYQLANGDILDYLIPSRNQCASCHATNHTTGAIEPIGIKARHLNRNQPGTSQNQLDRWHTSNLLNELPEARAIPASFDFSEAKSMLNGGDKHLNGDPLDHAARSYLDINCGHCHNPTGAADTSGLLLDYQEHSVRDMGMCKPPIAAGRGSGGLLYSIVPGHAADSILAFRMLTTDPGSMMPELGRSLSHQEGYALISAWINEMSGECL